MRRSALFEVQARDANMRCTSCATYRHIDGSGAPLSDRAVWDSKARTSPDVCGSDAVDAGGDTECALDSMITEPWRWILMLSRGGSSRREDHGPP